MTFPLLLVGLILLSYFIGRTIWILRSIRAYLLVMASYAVLNNISEEEIKEKCKVSSFWLMLFQLDNWQFTKYIKDTESYYDACMFHVELILKDLGLDKDNLNKE